MYRVKLTPTALNMLNSLHPEVRKQLKATLKELYDKPLLGKELREELVNFRSLKMKRYRAIYRVDNHNKHIVVYAIGHRKDIYEIFSELIQSK